MSATREPSITGARAADSGRQRGRGVNASRWAVAAGAAALVLGGVAGPAVAAGTPPAPAGSIRADQAEAAVLAAQIRADGQRLDQLAEQADAAQIRSQQLGSQLQAAQRRAAQLAAQLAVARRHLRADATAAYVNSNVPEYGQRSGQPGRDPSMTVGYAQVVSSEARQTIQQFVTLAAQEAAASRQLAQAKAAADASLAQLRADQQAAQAATETEQRALNGVNAQLRSLVAAAQAAQAAAMAAQVQARLASQRQLPPSSPVVTAASVQRASPTPSVVSRGTSASSAVSPRTAALAAASPTTVRSQSAVAPTTAASLRTAPPTPLRTATPTAPPTQAAAPRPTQSPAPPPTQAPAPPPTQAPAPPPTEAPAPPPTVAPAASAMVSSGPPSGASTALAYAYAQLGKPYQWGGAGPWSFDCSGLVMMAWGAAGVWFPHLAQDQYDMTQRISLSQLEPGDLVFFGTPDNVSHVGIYVGGGEMIDAPSTGNFVRVESIYWSDLLGAGRV